MITSIKGAACLAVPVLYCSLIAGCADLPVIGETHASLDAAIDTQLEQACPIQGITATDQQKLQLRMMRAQIILAAIAGYASTSISSYSSSEDIKTDSLLVLDRLKDAQAKLAQAKNAAAAGNNIFPLYRADLIIAAGGAADAALRPTTRAAKATLFAPSLSSDTVKRSKQLLLNILKDELYLAAIESACKQLDATRLAQQWKYATIRYKERCSLLLGTAGSKDASYCAELPWSSPVAAAPGGNAVAAAAGPVNPVEEED